MSVGAPPQEDPAAYWTRLLSDPAFRAMPPEQRTAFLTKHVAEVQAQAQSQAHTETAGQDMALGQAVGAVPKGKGKTFDPDAARDAMPAAPEAHPLDAAIDDPGADHQAELMRYVYGP